MHTTAFIFLASILLNLTSVCAAPPEGFSREFLVGDWGEIIGMTPTGDGRYIAWERTGIVWLVGNDGTMSMEPMLDIREEVGAWRDHGLLGFARDPDFLTNGYIYLMYVVDRHHLLNFGTPAYDSQTNEYNAASIARITRYTANAKSNFETVDPQSRFILIGQDIDSGFPILHQSHAVGSLSFGDDGTLLGSMGDSSSYLTTDTGGQTEGGWVDQALADGILNSTENIGAFRAQYLGSLCGKIFRIDPSTGNGVSSNPWFDARQPRTAASRIWTLGLRNGFRMTVVPGTGSSDPNDGQPGILSYGDVGWNAWEEMGTIESGGLNLGWPLYEGFDLVESYWRSNTPHPTAVNPLASDTCPSNFLFKDLLVENHLDSPPPSNPCNPWWIKSNQWSGPTIEQLNPGYSGNWYLDFGSSQGEWIDFDFVLPQGADSTFRVRYANGSNTNRPVNVLIDGEYITTLQIPPTGSWSSWRTAGFSAPSPLAEGKHEIRIETIQNAGPNIDRLEIPGRAHTTIDSVHTFQHHRPLLDWVHFTSDATRTQTITDGDFTIANLDSDDSPVSGSLFGGNSVTGGAWQKHPRWGTEWQGIYFADYVQGWLRVLRFDSEGKPVEVKMFDQTAGQIVNIANDPDTGDLIAIRWSSVPIRYSSDTPPCPADLNQDGVVSGADIGLLLSAWSTSGSGDLNDDSVVNGADLGLLLSSWGPCTP